MARPRGLRLLPVSMFFLLILFTMTAAAGQRLYVLPNSDLELDALPDLTAMHSAIREASPLLLYAPADPEFNLHRWRVIDLAEGADAQAVLAALESQPEIAFIERAPKRQLFAGGELDGLPNDPFASIQWHLDIIDAYAAWDLVPSSANVVLAVADLGMDMEHLDLADALWTNTAEANGEPDVDDDNNGYIDDIHGWDALDWNGDPTPSVGAYHGTHVGGIAGAVTDNSRGIAGTAPGVRLMNLRIGGSNSFGAEPSYDAIIYAVRNGADIVNMSYGGEGNSLFEKTLFDWVHSQGVVALAAAGNAGSRVKQYPAGYQPVIAVAATGPDDRLANFSQRGDWVDVAAPGLEIMSTVPDGYSFDSGTSMACPVAAGVCALILAASPQLEPQEVRARLIQGSEPLHNMPAGTILNGRINAWRSALANRPAVSIEEIVFEGAGPGNVILPGTQAEVQLLLGLEGADVNELRVGLYTLDGDITGTAQATLTNLDYPDRILVDPLAFTVTSNADPGMIPLGITLYADGYRDTVEIMVPVQNRWMTHQGGYMRATVTDFGAIGFTDLSGRMLGDGVTIPDIPGSALIHGSLLVNYGSRVSDAAYVFDFEPTSDGYLHPVNSNDYQIYEATYTHSVVSPSESNRVNQRSYSVPGSGGDDWVILEYTVTRTSSGSDPYRIGLYCDWDFRPYSENTVGYDATLGLSYVEGATGAGGIVALDNTPLAAVVAVDNPQYVYDGFIDADKNALMQMGTDDATASEPNDWSHIVAYDVGTLNAWESATARFGLVLATSVEELRTKAQQVRAAAGVVTSPRTAAGGAVPERMELSAHPNPFNSTTQLRLALPEAGDVQAAVYNTLGQQVAKLHAGTLPAGMHRLAWDGHAADGSPLASGVYLVKVQYKDLEEVRKVVLMR